MNVKELKEQLENLPDDMELYLQEDQEGNGYHECRGLDPNCYVTESGYNSEIMGEEALKDWYQEEAKEFMNQPKVGVLFP